MNKPYIVAVTVRNVSPTANTFFLDPVYITILSKNVINHNEQGLNPSTNPIRNVKTGKDNSSTCISPNIGRSITSSSSFNSSVNSPSSEFSWLIAVNNGLIKAVKETIRRIYRAIFLFLFTFSPIFIPSQVSRIV